MPMLLLAFSLPLALLLLAIAARMWERRLVWPYVPDDGKVPATRYTTAAAGAAQGLGFTPLGAFRDGKGRMYRIRYELWIAPGRDALLLVGGGSLAGIPVDGSWLFTRLGNGRCLATLDDEKGSEYDLAGLTQEAVHSGVPLAALLDAHRQRVASAEAPGLPYADAVADHREMLSRRIHSLVQRGYATFCGEAGEGWRYTANGALVVTFRSYGAGLRRAFGRTLTGKP
jgi:hypothetical protein